MSSTAAAAEKRIPGRATSAGTRRFAERAASSGVHASHFRCPDRLWLSSIGLGTRQGQPGGVDDLLYREAVATCLDRGCNVFNTAHSDRMQTSERAVGAALARAFAREGYARDEVIVVSKGGHLVADPEFAGNPAAARRYLVQTYLDSGLVDPHRLRNGAALDPAFICDQIARSRRNLRLETIDLYLVEDPELHQHGCEPSQFRRRLTALFEALEGEVKAGRIGGYGLATWDGFLVPFSERGHLSLVEIFDIALEAGGGDHHLRAIQLPYGVATAEAAVRGSQLGPTAQARGVLELLRDTGTTVLASAPLYGGRVLGRVPEFVRRAYPEARSDAQCCLQFVRGTAGIDAAIVGMRDLDHAEDNLALARCASADPSIAASLVLGTYP